MSSSPKNTAPLVLFAGAAGGCAVAIYNFLTPLTGVNGTFGAGLVIFSTALMALATLALPVIHSRGLRNLFRILLLLDVLCTAAAGYFLHEWWLIVAMAIALVGVLMDMATPARRRTTMGATT
ncbi:hypothetical protein ERN12_03585 [Rhodobacteraceae bacterium]|nr:hypothetical protein ERN12_03585 [Paracoccaceae bacterium]